MQHPWPLSSWYNFFGGNLHQKEIREKASFFVGTADSYGQYSESTRRLALILEDDGTSYKGFQWQSRVPSIQKRLESAIQQLTGETTRVRGASRTDSGVHAKGQVVDFLTDTKYSTDTFVRALNSYLRPDITVRGAWDAPLDFNSRKDAISRVYRYALLNAQWPSALMRDYSHWVRSPLDVASMSEAAGYLKGTHDFSGFTVSLPPGKSPVRSVKRWDVWREGELVFIEAEAISFLPHQVRRTNGVLVEIGLGKTLKDVIKGLIDGTLGELKRRPSLPAKGLCLMKVNYPN